MGNNSGMLTSTSMQLPSINCYATISHVDTTVQSAMLEKEKKEIQKIKFRQQKDIEQMLDYELKLDKIR